jgi:hypothetical protein
MVSKTPDEIAAMDPQERAKWRQEELNHVYGAGYKVGRDGRPLEQGLGASGNETSQHWSSLEKAEGAAAVAAAKAKANRKLGFEKWK